MKLLLTIETSFLYLPLLDQALYIRSCHQWWTCLLVSGYSTWIFKVYQSNTFVHDNSIFTMCMYCVYVFTYTICNCTDDNIGRKCYCVHCTCKCHEEVPYQKLALFYETHRMGKLTYLLRPCSHSTTYTDHNNPHLWKCKLQPTVVRWLFMITTHIGL